MRYVNIEQILLTWAIPACTILVGAIPLVVLVVKRVHLRRVSIQSKDY